MIPHDEVNAAKKAVCAYFIQYSKKLHTTINNSSKNNFEYNHSFYQQSEQKELSDVAIENFIRRAEGNEIRNPIAYMKYFILDAMQIGNVGLYADLGFHDY